MRKVKLGDVAIEHKETLKGSKQGLPVVGLEHLIPSKIRLQAWDMNVDNTFTKVFRKGNVLFGRRRAYLKKAVYAEFDGICSGDITVIEALPDKILPELLPFIIQNDLLFDYAVSKSAGSLSPRVKWEHLKNFEFELPEDMSEQKKLADMLWSMIETEEKYEDMIVATENLAKSQFIDLNSSAKIELSTSIGHLIKFMEKSRIKAGDGLDKGKYPLFNSSSEQTKWTNDYLFDDECIIIPTGGKAAVNYYNGKFSSTTDNFVIKSNTDVLTKYIYLFLKSNIDILQNGFKGSGLQHISKDYLKEIIIDVPNKTIQESLIKLAELTDKSKFELEKCLKELKETYKKVISQYLG